MNIFQRIWQHIEALWQTVEPPKVTPIGSTTTLADIVAAYNSPYITYYPPGSTTVNAQIGKNDDATNKLVASLIQSEAARVGLDYVYLAACIEQESRFSPACFNHNLNANRPTITFAHTDFGMCQMSGMYLPEKPGMQGLTVDQMSAKAMSAQWAVPVMAEVMVANVSNAAKYLATDALLASQTKKLNTTSLTDEQFLGTLFYNRGDADDEVNKVGGRYYIKNNVTAEIQHPFRVATWFDQFKKALGQ